MDLQNLTKKNQEFIHIATSQLIKDGKTDAEIKAILEEALPSILENQKKGITARATYGAPSDWAKSFATSTEKDHQTSETNDNPWLMWLDSSLLILAVLGLINGVMNLFKTGTLYGILTFLVIGFGVGAGIYMMYHFIYRNMGKTGADRPKFWKAILFLILTTIAWSVVFFLAALIPSTVNPTLTPITTILLGAAAFGLRYYLKKKFNIRNAMQPVQPS
ncbi:DUF1129 family protein [Streptococcus sp. X16XC17]|uniref:DUF1129 domain-containing protein n=1 Tax=unclassified Streptococcus TaxID=2608887 RepID=UPI00066FF4B5|nr:MULTISPECIES: DUF1129 family protein [unclassified Streptococcus]TCD45698.1 DUF1129 family protein [Streptococcus sp. X16XC17]